ncbi:MAG TPA: YdcF family protein [Bryobacteraceae bacterium]|nr:YdcF family protein [Bryobacteraceae bacterium]HOQ46286.1 YdcF family protein [Bryobacteraceae bacterium]HPQ16712.1 YdcF family protein [Bryobacteraceae bacterium]HPU72277.1 YdcF family protein [Bryobacteraceae bacterium]
MPFLRRAWRAFTVLAAGIGVLVLIVTFTPVVSWYARLLAGPWDDPKSDTMIVLGAGIIDSITPGPSTYWRAIYAGRFYREGGFTRVVASGKEVGPLIRDFLVCQGVPAEIIEVEGKSTSTRENAVYTARMLAGSASTPVLVTSDYHMFRARRAFQKAGLNVQPRPFPDCLKRYNFITQRWSAFLELVTETAKIAWYFVRGWI